MLPHVEPPTAAPALSEPRRDGLALASPTAEQSGKKYGVAIALGMGAMLLAAVAYTAGTQHGPAAEVSRGGAKGVDPAQNKVEPAQLCRQNCDYVFDMPLSDYKKFTSEKWEQLRNAQTQMVRAAILCAGGWPSWQPGFDPTQVPIRRPGNFPTRDECDAQVKKQCFAACLSQAAYDSAK